MLLRIDEQVMFDPGTGQVVLNVIGMPGTRAVLQESIDLKQWNVVQTNLFGTQPLQVQLGNAARQKSFYRLQQITN